MVRLSPKGQDRRVQMSIAELVGTYVAEMKLILVDIKDSDTPAMMRNRFRSAQKANGRFFGAIGEAGIAKRFAMFAYALDDLERGIMHPMFEAKKVGRGGRLPDSGEVWIGRALVAAAIRCFKNAGLDDGAIRMKLRSREKALSPLLRKGEQIGIRDNRRRANIRSSAFTWLKQFGEYAVDNVCAAERWKSFEANAGKLQKGAGGWGPLGQRLLDLAVSEAHSIPQSA